MLDYTIGLNNAVGYIFILMSNLLFFS